jgi:23S rRNA (pseudouridine1915-N3)-methyltransferase
LIGGHPLILSLEGVRIKVIAAGKPALAYAKTGIEEYLKRLTRYGSYEIDYLKTGSSEAVSAALLERSQGCYRIAMDERGKALGTQAWADEFTRLEMRSEIKTLAFLIGASDGHTPALRETCDAVWCLSALTMQHELALLVLMEQIYRVATLRRGEPYHR